MTRTIKGQVLQHILKWNTVSFASANKFQGAFSQIPVLKVLQMLHDGFAGVAGAWCTPCVGSI